LEEPTLAHFIFHLTRVGKEISGLGLLLWVMILDSKLDILDPSLGTVLTQEHSKYASIPKTLVHTGLNYLGSRGLPETKTHDEERHEIDIP
jgi:hypothetical protein